MKQNLYRTSRFKRAFEVTFRSAVVVCFALGVGVTAYTVFGLGKYYLFQKPTYARQQREYAEAILLKEKREKELGLRD